MSEFPKVSVVVPTYNNERYLTQCLDSLKLQTMEDFEVICVNDGSTDGSLAIMHRFCEEDKRFSIIDKPNSGYGHSMNCGLTKAQGDYIAILESDDFIAPTMFEELCSLAEKNDLDFIKADFQAFFGEGATRRFEYKRICPDQTLYNKVINPIDNLAAFDVDMVTWTGVYRRDFLTKHNIRYNETPGAAYQDNGFWLQTFSFAKRIMFVNRAFYQYRQDNPNSSINSKTKVFCMCDEHAFMHEFLTAHPEFDRRIYCMWSKKMFHNYNFTYLRIAAEYKEQFLQRYASDFRKAFERKEIRKSDFYEDEWAKINDIVDDPHLAYLKFENLIENAQDSLVERYQLRQQQAIIDDFAQQLAVYQTSKAFRIAGLVKRANDYRCRHGITLRNPALHKAAAATNTRNQNLPTIEIVGRPEPALMYADGYTALDNADALLNWYRRKTGSILALDDAQNAESLVQNCKLRNTHIFSERIGSLSRVFNYAQSLIEPKLLPDNTIFFNTFELLENYLFEHQLTSFYIKSNAKLEWSVFAQDSASVDRNTMRFYSRQLNESNLAFVAGEPLASGDEVNALCLLQTPISSRDAQKITICCSDGFIIGGIAHSALRNTSNTYLDSESISSEIAAAAKNLCQGFPFVTIVFAQSPQGTKLVSMNCGIKEGLVGDVDVSLQQGIINALN